MGLKEDSKKGVLSDIGSLDDVIKKMAAQILEYQLQVKKRQGEKEVKGDLKDDKTDLSTDLGSELDVLGKELPELYAMLKEQENMKKHLVSKRMEYKQQEEEDKDSNMSALQQLFDADDLFADDLFLWAPTQFPKSKSQLWERICDENHIKSPWSGHLLKETWKMPSKR